MILLIGGSYGGRSIPVYKSSSIAKVLWQLSLKTAWRHHFFFFSFASTQLFLICFKVNIRALSRVSCFSPNSKVKNTIMQTIISFDYHNFSIFLKIQIRQNWTPNSSFLAAFFIFSHFSRVPSPFLSALSCEIILWFQVRETEKVWL